MKLVICLIMLYASLSAQSPPIHPPSFNPAWPKLTTTSVPVFAYQARALMGRQLLHQGFVVNWQSIPWARLKNINLGVTSEVIPGRNSLSLQPTIWLSHGSSTTGFGQVYGGGFRIIHEIKLELPQPQYRRH